MKLNDLVKYAYKNCEYYRNKYENYKQITTFEELPILEKTELLNFKFSIISDDYKNFNFSNFVDVTTSGTDGIPLTMFWDENEYIKSNYILWKYRKMFYGVSPKDRCIRFVSDKHNLSKSYYMQKNTMIVIKEKINDENINIIFEEMFKFSPIAMYMQPSTLLYLIEKMESYDFKFPKSLKYIELTGEVFNLELRLIFKKKFPNIKLVNMYGTEENNGIAYECPFHNLHILEENVYVECINKDKNGIGEAIITNLQNTVMPLIRYNVRDLIKINQKVCKCGIKGKIIDIIEGRKEDIYYENDLKISSYSMSSIIFYINNALDFPIKQYKVQFLKNKKTLIFYLALDENFVNWKLKIKKMIIECLQNKFLDNFKYVILFKKEIISLDKKIKPFEVIYE